jgi:hypothetical protein
MEIDINFLHECIFILQNIMKRNNFVPEFRKFNAEFDY